MSVWRAWKSISPQTRVMIGCGFMAWSLIGLTLSDAAEKKFGLEPSAEEKDKLNRVIPKITVVDRDAKPSELDK